MLEAKDVEPLTVTVEKVLPAPLPAAEALPTQPSRENTGDGRRKEWWPTKMSKSRWEKISKQLAQVVRWEVDKKDHRLKEDEEGFLSLRAVIQTRPLQHLGTTY